MMKILTGAIPGFIASMALEYASSRAVKKAVYEPKDAATSIAMGLGNVALEFVVKKAVKRGLDKLYEHRAFDLRLKGPAKWATLILCEDFMYYWFHRASHEMRLFWAAHVNHHSSEHYNLSTALRQSWTTPITKPLFNIPLVLMGFKAEDVLTANAINLLYQFWVHTELIDNMGWFEEIMNTPSHHRAHHGSNLEYLDRNYAGIFIIWDRLFGTFEREDAPVDYGLLKNIRTHNLWTVAFHEWADMIRAARQASSLSQAIQHVVRPPGWSPDKSSLTVPELRAAAQRKHTTTA